MFIFCLGKEYIMDIKNLLSEKKEHLKMIEDIIARMANNSFLLKSWAVSLISAILLFADYKQNLVFVWMAICPIFVFWFLDALYLQLERKYKKLYKLVRQDYIDKTNKITLFDMDTKNIEVEKLFCIMFSKSIVPIYSIILATVFFILKNI